MRQRIAEHKKAEDEEQEPPPAGNFGFHYPEDYVRDTVRFLLLSNWVCWPDAGGWAEQSKELIADVFTFLAIRRQLEWEVKTGINSDYEPLPEGEKLYRLSDL